MFSCYISIFIHQLLLKGIQPILKAKLNKMSSDYSGETDYSIESMKTNSDYSDNIQCINPISSTTEQCMDVPHLEVLNNKDMCLFKKIQIPTTVIKPPKEINLSDEVKVHNVGYYVTKASFSNITHNNATNGFTISFRRKNKCINMQWEECTVITAANVSYITLLLTIINLPPHPIDIPYFVTLKGKRICSFIHIDGKSKGEEIKFYLNKGKNLETATQVIIHGSSVIWGI